jgi:electron transfer DM13
MRTSLAATARRFLRWEFVPEAVLFIGLTAFFVHQNDAATSAFKSTKAVAIMAAVTLGWLGARVLFARLVPFALGRAAVFSVAAAVALSVVVFPAYDNETVIESFPTAAAATPMPAPAELAAPPATKRAGAFRGIDHRASGSAVIYRQPDGRYVGGLEDIDIQPGPDYDLYVVPGADRRDTKGGIRLGDLRGNRGTQFYDVPAGVNLEDGPWTVLVWCQTFAVPVANATPS